MKKRKPIAIPSSFAQRRDIINLVTAWRNLMKNYHWSCKRLNWYSSHASTREKRRRQKKWEYHARLLTVEKDLLRSLGKATHHKDLWTPKSDRAKGDPLDPSTLSRHARLIRAYHKNRTQIRQMEKRQRAAMVAERRIIVEKIHDLEWQWISALFYAVAPGGPLPERRKTAYPTTLRPRKLLQYYHATDTTGVSDARLYLAESARRSSTARAS